MSRVSLRDFSTFMSAMSATVAAATISARRVACLSPPLPVAQPVQGRGPHQAIEAGDTTPVAPILQAQRTQAQGDPLAAELLDTCVLESILSVSRPGDTLLDRVIGLYSEHAPRHVGRLAEIEHGDAAAVADAAHALKSMSRNAGARRIAEVAGEIERRARTGAPFDEHLVDMLREQLTLTLTALSDFGARAAGEPSRANRIAAC